jgi:tetraacyldisaccharide 4'-kinase
VLVSDGSKICESVSAVGDEPTLMAERLESVPIVVSADRFEGCQWLIKNFKTDVILLDDGFQHIRLERDMNILVVDASNPFGNRRLLPRGPLREPILAMQRADLVIFTRADRGSDIEELRREIARSGLRMLQSTFRPTGLTHLNTGLRYPVSDLKNCPILCVCGIGNPESFVRSMRGLGAQVKGELIFGDHHAYVGSDFLKIKRQIAVSGAGRVVTTEKDAAKIKPFLPMDLEIWVLQIDVAFLDDPKEYEPLLFNLSVKSRHAGENRSLEGR